MEQPTVIYADVLFFVNLFMNLLALKATALLDKSRVKNSSLLLAAGIGAVYSLTFLWAQTALFLLLPARLLLAGILIVTAFPYVSAAAYLREYLLFFAVNLLFTGALLLLRRFSGHIYLNNGILYCDVSLLSLALCTIAAYLLISLVSRVLKSRPEPESFCPVLMTVNGKELTLTGFWDSGNGLRDYFTGLPVVICEYQALAPLLTPAQREYARFFFSKQLSAVYAAGKDDLPPAASQMRPVFLSTAKGSEVLPALKPDFFALCPDDKDSSRPCQVLAALSDQRLMGGDAQVLLNRLLS